MDLTLNKPKEFGYEFLFNFEQSLNQFNKNIFHAKSQLYNQLKSDNQIIARDIDGK
jgi:hypothetical protein